MTIDIYDHQIYDDTHDEYTVKFYQDSILTLVTPTPSLVDDWISEIEFIHRRRLDRLIVGLDVEWRPSYSRIENPVATLQLCVGRRCLIFQILHAEYIPYSLKNFLNNDDYTFTGVGIGADVKKLERDYDIEVARIVDLRRLGAEELGMRGLNNAGMKELARRFLGAEIEKPRRITMSDWDQPWLTDDQVSYACVDAFVSFEIGRVLIQGH
ncbi:3'-5' exonuclease-like [Rutidosis leptorrhynchoides]|uniref:3'-5' exonuclease-like n=1 Tax=Rutidosis leptorrhynchoides TaxID=125765 RepID=UPI003A9A2CDC